MTTFHCDDCETTEGLRVASAGGSYAPPAITCKSCFVAFDGQTFDDLPTVDSLSPHSVARYESDLAAYRQEMAESEALSHVTDAQMRANLDKLIEHMEETNYILSTRMPDRKYHEDECAFYKRELARRAARAPSFAVAAE